MTWVGFYSVGVVASVLGMIWQPQYRFQWILTLIVMVLAVVFAASSKRVTSRNSEEELEEEVEEGDPQTLYSNGWPVRKDQQ